jgi:hypothetical protein
MHKILWLHKDAKQHTYPVSSYKCLKKGKKIVIWVYARLLRTSTKRAATNTNAMKMPKIAGRKYISAIDVDEGATVVLDCGTSVTPAAVSA